MRNLTAVKLSQYLPLKGRKGTWVITDQFNFHLQEEKKNTTEEKQRSGRCWKGKTMCFFGEVSSQTRVMSSSDKIKSFHCWGRDII